MIIVYDINEVYKVENISDKYFFERKFVLKRHKFL